MKKREIWKAVKNSRIPIMIGLLTVFELSVDVACSNAPWALLNSIRVGIFYEMSKEGVTQGMKGIRSDKVEQAYNEIQDEIIKLQ